MGSYPTFAVETAKKNPNINEAKKKMDNPEDDTFHRAIAPFLIFCQIFGAMPLYGITNRDSSKINFRWISSMVFFTISFLIYGCVTVILFVNKIFDGVLFLKTFTHIVFLFSTLPLAVLLLNLAKRWPKLIQFWTKVDLIFLQLPYTPSKIKLSTQVLVVLFGGIFFRLIEYLLYGFSTYTSYAMHLQFCNVSSPPSLGHYLTTFVNPVLFDYIGYNIFYIIIVMLAGLLFIFYNCISDIFVIIVSFSLVTRFKQFNVRVEKLTGLILPENVWGEIRADYVKICELVETVDENISAIILIFSGSNVYFICTRLLHVFVSFNESNIESIAKWFGVVLLILRIIVPFLSAAAIYDQSKLCLKTIHRVPSESWCSEIQRLVNQINCETIALSGMKFFYVTRKLLFAMAGTIITYELVLLQMNGINKTDLGTFDCDNL